MYFLLLHHRYPPQECVLSPARSHPYCLYSESSKGGQGAGDEHFLLLFCCYVHFGASLGITSRILGRHDICQKIYTAVLSGQEFYTGKMRNLRPFHSRLMSEN